MVAYNNTIRIKRRATGASGAPASLANAELAYNEVDDVLYYGKGTGGANGTATSVIAIAGSGAVVGITGTQTITGDKTFSGAVALGSTATAVTKTAGDNSTAVATTAYVATAVAAVGAFAGLTFAGDSGTTQSIASGDTLTVSGGTGLSSTASATDTVTINLDNTSVSAGSYGSASAIPTFTVDAQGRLTAAGTASISTSFTVDADSGTDLTISGGDNFVIVGGTGLTSVASATDTLTLNLDNTAVTAGSYGSATAVSTFTVDAQGRLTAAGTANISVAASAITDFNEAAQDAVGGILGTGLTYSDSTNAIGVNSGEMINKVLDAVSGNSYGLIGNSVYLDVINTNGYHKEIELDIAAVETKLNTDGYITATSTSTLTNKTLTSPVITGAVFNDGSVVFEGATADAFETTLAVTDPTADRTITLPDATGTVQLRVADVDDTEIGYLNGVTSAIQTQLDAKASLSGATFTGAVSGTSLTLSGVLTVNGTTTTVNSVTVTVDDKNIELGAVATPTDAGADGGGITLKGTTDKTFNWVDATDAWTSSENMNLATGKAFQINGTSVLSGSTLGSGVTGSSLTSVGTIATGVWNGTTIAIANGGTGSTTASDARTALGLAIGTNVQAYNSTLAAVAGGTYTGDDSITTLGTITTGTWNGTTIAIANGGTGSTTESGARTALGLAIGTDVQAYSSILADVALGNYTLDGGTF